MAIHLTSTGVVYDATNSPAQTAGSGSANTLDDYEEGAWTPVGVAVTVQSLQLARYVKTGEFVWEQFYFTATGGTGQSSYLTGAPFTTIAAGHTAATVNLAVSNATLAHPHIRKAAAGSGIHFTKNNDNGLAGQEMDGGHVLAGIGYLTA